MGTCDPVAAGAEEGPDIRFILPFSMGKSLPVSGSSFRGLPLKAICSNGGAFGRVSEILPLLSKGRLGNGFIACGDVR